MESSMEKTHGGARRNAGRKTEMPGEKMRKVTITVDEVTVRRLRVVGDGNVARGVRHAAQVAYDKWQRQ